MHFAEGGVVQAVFGPPGLLPFGEKIQAFCLAAKIWESGEDDIASRGRVRHKGAKRVYTATPESPSFFYLSFPSLSLSLFVSLFLSFSLSLSLPLFLCFFFSLSLSLPCLFPRSLSLSLSLSICVCFSICRHSLFLFSLFACV